MARVLTQSLQGHAVDASARGLQKAEDDLVCIDCAGVGDVDRVLNQGCSSAEHVGVREGAAIGLRLCMSWTSPWWVLI